MIIISVCEYFFLFELDFMIESDIALKALGIIASWTLCCLREANLESGTTETSYIMVVSWDYNGAEKFLLPSDICSHRNIVVQCITFAYSL